MALFWNNSHHAPFFIHRQLGKICDLWSANEKFSPSCFVISHSEESWWPLKVMEASSYLLKRISALAQYWCMGMSREVNTVINGFGLSTVIRNYMHYECRLKFMCSDLGPIKLHYTSKAWRNCGLCSVYNMQHAYPSHRYASHKMIECHSKMYEDVWSEPEYILSK